MTIINYILIIYELSNFEHVLGGIMRQTRVSGGNPNLDPHVNIVAHCPVHYQGTLLIILFLNKTMELFNVDSIIFNFN